MKLGLKYLVFIFLGLFIITGAVFAYLFFNKEKIKEYALAKINSQLTVELKIKEVNVALFSQFPKVSIDMQHIEIADLLNTRRHLLQADHLYVGFNIFDLIRGNYNIKLIKIEQGQLNLYANKQGKNNYSILKSAKGNTGDEAFLVNLKEVIMKNIEVEYVDERYQQFHTTLFKDVSFYGDFNERGESVGLQGDLIAHKLRSDKLILVNNKPVKVDVVFKADHQKNVYTFEKGFIDIDQLKLTMTGKIINKPESVYFDLEASARNLNIASLLSAFPIQNLPEDLKSEGELNFKGSIKGNADDKHAPAMLFKFGVDNGTLQKGDGLTLKNIQFKGELSNGANRNMRSSLINLSDLSFSMNNQLINGNLSVNNFNDPIINTSLKGKIKANDVLDFFQYKTIKSAEGTIDFDINFNGKTRDLNADNWLNNNSSGHINIDLKDINFKETDKSIKKISAILQIKNRNAHIEKFEAEFSESDVQITGELNNIVPYLLTDQPLEANIHYTSNNINLNNFIMPLSPASIDDKNAGFALPENIQIDAMVKAARFEYNSFVAKNVTASVKWKGKKITTENLHGQTMDGQLTLDGEIENAKDGRFLISATATLMSIDINHLFKACNNFGQQEITEKHIHGKLSGTFDLVSVWSNDLHCDLNKLYALCDIHVKQGELKGYKPLEALSKYVDVKDLQNLKFADLDNTIEIKNKTIFIPAFDIKNNALNMILSGTHTFENYIDYKIKLKLNELLKNKRKPSVNEFNEETPDGGMNLFLSMKGPIDNFKISYDKKEVKQQLKQDIKKEKTTIKEILKKEFGGDEEKKIKEKKKDDDELEFEPD